MRPDYFIARVRCPFCNQMVPFTTIEPEDLIDEIMDMKEPGVKALMDHTRDAHGKTEEETYRAVKEAAKKKSTVRRME